MKELFSKIKELIKRILIAPIRFYQRFISPCFPPVCRYHPTCSQYAIEAIQVHGPVKGSLLAIARILRCNPLFAGGYDPVPPKKGRKSKRRSHTR